MSNANTVNQLSIRHKLVQTKSGYKMVRSDSNSLVQVNAVYSEAGLPDGVQRVRTVAGDVFAARRDGDLFVTVAYV